MRRAASHGVRLYVDGDGANKCLRCVRAPPRRRNRTYAPRRATGKRHFQMEWKNENCGGIHGHDVSFVYWNRDNNPVWEHFAIDCGDWQALGSSALPRASSEFRVSSVFLNKCPLPAGNASIANAFAAMNLTLHPNSNETSLELSGFPAEQLMAQQFVGLPDITYLKIYGHGDPHQRPTPEPGFLVPLQNLKMLHMIDVRLGAGEIHRLPKSVTKLWLGGESLNSLPGTLQEIMSETTRALPGLTLLMLDHYQFSAPEYSNTTNINIVQPNATSSITTIYLMNWKAPKLAPLDQCNKLRKLDIHNPKVVELPDRWLAACPLIKEVSLANAQQLRSLPAKLLEGATSLQTLTIRSTRIRTLPRGLFESTPNLVELDLTANHLLRLDFDKVFLSPVPQSLTKLNLDYCERFSVFCDQNGYSTFQNFTNLKSLSVSTTRTWKFCADWRENLKYLEKLNIKNTEIWGLKYSDFLITRDASVKDTEVELSASIAQFNFTREDYERAVSASGASVTLKFDYSRIYRPQTLYCDCDLYWLKRALTESKVFKFKAASLPCSDGKDFLLMTPEEICPELANQTQKLL